ncbi:type VII secretion protein EccB [Mycolicibacterium rhodesiae]|uniref:Type VII secretion protein EccB n=1 Tax=Mycolicibacterium rhodesiae TaxID=36814 RepID=A0A1X0J1A7_MYCRH|nr:type VII secretion protein EccB [Mycolicibacterium rhodesiae]MCV7344883.1 type VII secretion protein EccB [Mycolicibacterium rhodesiae]ORB55670.1 type VII secretion protein EccB [Mycolicibacterium rhodesiae]
MSDDRRSFSSRTPANDNAEQVTYRRGFITRHQVTGWRFVMRRIASGLALHDTRMLVDPLRSQSRAVLMGVLLVVTAVLGCFVFSVLRPGGVPGSDPVLADRSTAALYVRVGDRLHPVLNLTSARLAVGRAVDPTTVSSEQLDKFARGSLIGIPGAPERMVQNTSRDGDWAVCDGSAGSDQAGVTVIAGQLERGGARAALLGESRGVLVGGADGTWLLWDGRRSAIDLADRAVTDALGLPAATPTARPIAAGLFNAIPEAPALRIPQIPEAGSPAGYPIPAGAPIGAVVIAYRNDGTPVNYAVLPDGLQPISPVLAAALRNANSYGLAQPPQLGADDIARLPVSAMLDVSAFPSEPIKLVDAATAPVTCAQWTKIDGAATSSTTLLSGSVLPVAGGMQSVDLVGGGNPGTATRVALPPGRGYFVQTVGQQPASPPAGSLFWVSDTGVRYGIGGDPKSSEKTVAALGLSEPPLPIPWSVLTLFAPGPALSQTDALVVYDAVRPVVQQENR